MKYIYTLAGILALFAIVACNSDQASNTTHLSEQFSSADTTTITNSSADSNLITSTGNAKMDSFVSAVPKDRIVHHASANATAAERAAVDLCNCTHFYTKMLEITMEISPNDVGFRDAYFKVIEKEAPIAAKCMSDVRRSFEQEPLNKENPQEFGAQVDKYIEQYCPNLIKVMAAAAEGKKR